MIKRSDRRTDYSQLRQFAAAQNVLNQADGSARFDIGDTSVLVSVLGPVEVQIRDEKLDEATVEVVVRPAVGVSTTTERLWERYLRTAFEPVILGGLMPRTLVQIVVQILKDDGSVLAASINAISLALLDAGIPMKYMAAAMSCMVDKSTKEVIMDPTAAELENAASVHTFAFDSINTTAHALLSDSIGDFTPDEYFACHDKCFEAASKVHAFLRSSVEEKKRKEHQQQQMKE